MSEDGKLQDLEKQLQPKRNFDSPPLHLWHPELSGDIPIRITADGTWYHDGGKIERDSLVRLFASILRREDDGEYYLVSPVEKWRIEVELHPLMVIDVTQDAQGDSVELVATLNTGRKIVIAAEHPLFLEPAVGNIAALELNHGLTALFNRSAWYRLVEFAEGDEATASVESRGVKFNLMAD